MGKIAYRRVLLKMSGEVLMGNGHDCINPEVLDRLVHEVSEIHRLGVQVAIVIGGGNFFRGAKLSEIGITRLTGDHMGMLATMINGLALRDAFERANIPARLLSAIDMNGVVDAFNRRKAIHHLEEGRIVLFSGGTGNPLVTTDSAASLRGIEIASDVVLKATDVDGIYSTDPAQDPSAQLIPSLSFDEALDRQFAVMDLAAFCQCRDYRMPLRVFNITKPGALLRVIQGEPEGTCVYHSSVEVVK